MSIDNHTRSVVVVVVTRSVCLSILFFFGFAIHPPRFALSSHFALFLRDSSHWGGSLLVLRLFFLLLGERLRVSIGRNGKRRKRNRTRGDNERGSGGA